MRYFLPLLALPFLAVAQNFTSQPDFVACAAKCAPPQALQQCGADFACYCTVEGVTAALTSCMQKDCPDVLAKYGAELAGACPSGAPPSSSSPSSSRIPSPGVSVSSSAAPSIPPASGNITTPTTTGSHSTTKKSTTTHAPKPTGNSTSPSGTITVSPGESSAAGNKTSAPTTTTSTGAAAVLEVAMQWPIAIAIGLVGAAAL